MVRLFIGIMLPEEIKGKIVSIQNSLERLPIACKMVEKENLHICLSFLGEKNECELDDIKKKLDEICQRYHSFTVKVSGIKLIPNERYIRVLALGCFDGLLETLGKNIMNEIGGDAKPPHLTLCRIRSIKDKEAAIEEIKKIDSDVGESPVSSIQLIKSELQRGGPIYSTIHESELLGF